MTILNKFRDFFLGSQDRVIFHEPLPILQATGAEAPPPNEYLSSSQSFKDAARRVAESAPGLPGMFPLLDQFGMRSMNQSFRDIPEAARMNILYRADWLSSFNPLCSRSLGIRTNLICSEGFDPKSNSDVPKYNEEVQAVLDEHWARNKWDERLVPRCSDLQITGEQWRCLPPLDRVTGSGEKFMMSGFKCRNLPTQYVQQVNLDAWDRETIESVNFSGGYLPNDAQTFFRIVNEDLCNPGEYQRLSGEMLPLSLNRKLGQTRGMSDFASAVEWLDLYDQALFTEAERVALMMRFVWDITLDGASRKQCETYAQNLRSNPPMVGTARVHNEKEHWDAVSPDFGTSGADGLTDKLLDQCLGAMGLSKIFWVDAENVNKANGETMMGPAFDWARVRRDMQQDYLVLECRMAIQVARDSGRLAHIPVEHCGFDLVSRDPDRNNYQVIGDGLKSLTESLIASVQGQLLSQGDAVGIYKTVAGSYGFELSDKAPVEDNKNDPNMPEQPTSIGDMARLKKDPNQMRKMLDDTKAKADKENDGKLENTLKESIDRLDRLAPKLCKVRPFADVVRWKHGKMRRGKIAAL